METSLQPQQMMKPTRRLEGHKHTVTCSIASRTTPGLIATSGEDGYICWFDMRCKDVIFTMDIHKPISSICFKHENEEVLYACSGTEVMSYDVRVASSWKPLETYNYNKEEINQICCSSKSSFIAAADDSGDIKIIDIRQHCLYKTLRSSHTSICSSVQFLPWGPWEVITGGLDAKLMLWDFSKGKACKIMDFGLPDMESHGSGEQCFNPAFIHAVAVPELDMLDKCDKICAVARGDGTVDVVDIDSELSSFKLKPRNPNPSASRSTTTSVDRKEGKRIHLDTSLGGHSAAASCVSFSLFGEKGRYIISGGNDAFVKVWDWSKDLEAGEGNVLRQNISLRKKVNWICSTPSDSENLVVCDTSKIVKNKVPNSTTDNTQQVGLHRDGSKSSSTSTLPASTSVSAKPSASGVPTLPGLSAIPNIEAVKRAQELAAKMGFHHDPEFAPIINMFPGQQLPTDVTLQQKPAKAPVLRLDQYGNAIDEHGNVINMSKPTNLSTLKVNINKQKKDAFQILKPELDVDLALLTTRSE